MATELSTEQPESGNGVTSVAEWKRRAVHEVTLFSGARVVMRFPNLAFMLEKDAVPSRLLEAALRELTTPGAIPVKEQEEGETGDGSIKFDQDMIKQMSELARWLVLQSVVSPKLTPEDLDPETGIPSEDVDLLISLARRERDRDARGVKLGVEPLERFATFREEHECAEGCEACSRVVARFSTYRTGDV